MSANRYIAVVLLLFALSGFSGLIYESIWSHYLKLFLGHAAYAQVLVLSIFMGGMAVGSFFASKLSQYSRNTIRLYAAVELVIGLLGLGFHYGYVAVSHYTFGEWLPGLADTSMIGVAKWGIAALLIFPQSVLLGATFPLLTSGLIRKFPERQGSHIALMYFANSLGASLGILANAFIFIPDLGLPGALTVAGGINVLLALLFWLLSRGEQLPLPQPSAHQLGQGVRVFYLIALFTGMASFIYEISWIRMLSMVLGASTHAFELMLSAFILGLAIGSLMIRRVIDRIQQPEWVLAVIQIVMGLFALSTLIFYNYLFDLMVWAQQQLTLDDAGFWHFSVFSYGLCMLIMLPVTICAGATLPLITSILMRRNGHDLDIGKVYAANTIGAIAGISLSVLVLMPVLGLKGLLAVGALIDVMLGIYLIQKYQAKEVRYQLVVVASLGIFAVVMMNAQLDVYKMASGVFRGNALMTADGPERIPFVQDGRTSTVHIIANDGYLSIANNGKIDATVLVDEHPGRDALSDESTMMLIAALGLAYQPDARQIANIGLGSGLTSHMLLASPKLERLDNIEIEEAIIEGAKLFAHRVERVYKDERSHFIIDDAKTAFLSMGKKYDVIVSEPSNPWISGIASLFTQEFYRTVSRYMDDDGLFIQWVQVYNLNMDILASINTALKSEFPYRHFYQVGVGDLAIVASRSPLPALSDTFFSYGDMQPRLASVGVLNTTDIQARQLADSELLDQVLDRAVPMNSDYYPYVTYEASRAKYKRQNIKYLYQLHNARFAHRLLNTQVTTANPNLTLSEHFAYAFPNRRAGLFFEQYEALLAGQLVEQDEIMGLPVKQLFKLLHQCESGDANAFNVFKGTVTQLMEFAPEEKMVALFSAAERAPCLKAFHNEHWFAVSAAWFKQDYQAVLALMDQWQQRGIALATYEDMHLMKMQLVAMLKVPGFAPEVFARIQPQADLMTGAGALEFDLLYSMVAKRAGELSTQAE